MAVTRKPVARSQGAAEHAKPDEAAIRAVIERGGSVAGENQPDDVERKLLQLRLPVALIARIDTVARGELRPLRDPRTAGIDDA